MTVVLATIAIIFLMMPGFVFIAGVNLTDKNVREIVFRGTPAELSYVVAISLIVHSGFAWLPVASLSPGIIIQSYLAWTPTAPSPDLSHIIAKALAYVIVTACAGGILGFLLGTLILRYNLRFFIKHRWMIELIAPGKGKAIYARALTTPAYSIGETDGDSAILVEGTIRDCYFAADGTLLYLVFTRFQERIVRIGEPVFSSKGTGHGYGGPLVLEGRHVVMVRYERFSAAEFATPDALDRLEQETTEQLDDDVNGSGV